MRTFMSVCFASTSAWKDPFSTAGHVRADDRLSAFVRLRDHGSQQVSLSGGVAWRDESKGGAVISELTL
jgi:hypothetical protein